MQMNGRRARARRCELDMSTEDVAAQIRNRFEVGCASGSVRNWENGSQPISERSVHRLAAVLGLEFADLMPAQEQAAS